jgi:pyruvate, water dikinase
LKRLSEGLKSFIGVQQNRAFAVTLIIIAGEVVTLEEFQDISGLIERAKELECLYLIDEAMTKDTLSDIMMEVSRVAPLGFRDIDACTVTVMLDNNVYAVKPEIEDGHDIVVNIIVNSKVRGYIKASYPQDICTKDGVPFFQQEERLLKAIRNRLAQAVIQNGNIESAEIKSNWKTIVELLQITDQEMLLHICEKMLALLAKTNQKLVEDILVEMNWVGNGYQGEFNCPQKHLPAVDVIKLSNSLFKVAGSCFSSAQIFDYISLWIYQGKTYELIKIVNKKNSDVRDIAKALTQYLKAVRSSEVSSNATQRWLLVELIRRFLTDNPKLIENARKYVSVEAFCELLDRFICSPHSYGKVGGKATGFFIANQIIKAHTEQNPSFANIKVPKTWYISSDELDNLIYENGLDELNEHKYREVLEIRIYYPKIIQTIKNSKLSAYVINQLKQILEECEDKPLIVRSSSMLEDQIDSSFSGKYKSLFVTNTGTKAERLKNLVEAILEVYSSMFNPDTFQYRKERNLLDCNEQMGIMIQEVVGFRVGPYYLPLYAGVAFSNNELRWSPRIRREDGLIRIVMGLGTRAVDRVGDDYPVLISPGQPKLSVNQSTQELRRYSPQMLDVINMENNKFISISIEQLIKEFGNKIPQLNVVLSVLKNDFISEFNRFNADFKKDDFIVSFDGLINKTPIVSQIGTMLSLLKEKLGYPVDIEFASDGNNFYLLQCRPQCKGHDNISVAIPTSIAVQNTVFTANKYISNGKVVGIKTVVYVDPEEYGKLESHQDLVNVAYAVSELNRILPRRSFILMGPGRWGSRGDIKLGVQVTYSDINNTSMLIEVAQKKSRYKPDLSFGTHFFQDLVEADIKYLPLYPEDDEVIFSRSFFNSSKNALSEILPSYSYLKDVIKVINVEENFFGKELVVLMNADLEKAVAYLEPASKVKADPYVEDTDYEAGLAENEGWKWRHYMAEKIAAQLDLHEYSVKGIYLFGSTNSCTATLNSDIDLLVHFDGNEEQKQKLSAWLDGWSKALAEMNFLKTGYMSEGLLDVHYVTDKDIEEKDSYAIKINSIYDPPLPLRVRGR